MRAAVADVHGPLERLVPVAGPGEVLGPVNPRLPGNDTVLVVDAGVELDATSTGLNRYVR